MDGVFVGVCDRRPIDQLALFGRIPSTPEQGFDPLKREVIDLLAQRGPVERVVRRFLQHPGSLLWSEGRWTLLTLPGLFCFAECSCAINVGARAFPPLNAKV